MVRLLHIKTFSFSFFIYFFISCSLDETVEFYRDDLPNPAVISTELSRWKTKWMKHCADDLPSNLKYAIRSCDEDFYILCSPKMSVQKVL